MRRMVGAAVVVVGLGTVTVLRWFQQPSPIIEAPATPDSPAASPDSVLPQPPTPITRLANPLAFLSTAASDSLELLPGVGPVLAARLIAARAANGAFRSWDDVDRVRGIGPKTIERLKALATR